jgi:hypothetical protein
MIASPDFHLFGYSARRPIAARQRGQHRPMRVLAPFPCRTTPTLLRKTRLLLARLKRFLDGRVAAVIAHHEQQAALFAQLDRRQLDSTRIYRGPIDQVFAKPVSLRKRAA